MIRRNLPFAWRSLGRRPLSSAAAIATLAIGIGLNAAVFSVVDWVLLRPLPYPSPHELVKVSTAGTAPVTGPAAVTYSEFAVFSRATAFRASAAFSTATRVIAGQGVEPAHAVVARVTGDLFGTLGVQPETGRAINLDEAASGAPVVIVSHAVWMNRFSADAAIAGRGITIDGRPHTVIGVMPEGRGYPRDADLWRPLTADEREDDDRELLMIGRLASATPVERATVELATLANTVSRGGRRAWADEMHRTEVADVRAALTALLGSAALILLMACANVAAIVGARGAERAGEMAVRGALGATRAQLMRQLLGESVLLAGAGGLAGLLIGEWTLDLLVALAPAGIPRLAEIALDGRVILVSAAATLVVGLIVGVLPAIRSSRVDLRSHLAAAGFGRASERTQGQRLLVAAQTAMAVVLTIGAGLLGRSLQSLVTIDNGFAADRLLAVDLYLRGGMAGDARTLYRNLIENAEAIPGVRAAAVALQPPTRIAGLRVSVRAQGAPFAATATATLRPVTTRYFETIGIPLTTGRTFSVTDTRTAPRVAIVNTAFVRDVLGGTTAVGARLTTDVVDGPLSVVGVVANVTPAGQSDRPALYVSVEQIAVAGGVLLVRTDSDPQSVVPALRTRLRAAAPGLALDRISRVAETLEAGRSMTRFNTQLASAFAGLAMLLSAIGVYGLTAGEVATRWREIAIRLALGATRREATWTTMRPGASALAIGAAIGIAAALAAGRSMTALLHGIEPTDPPTLVAVPVLLAIVGLAAASLAAVRVLRADPAATLRGE
jgi:predicted permease